MIALLDGDLIIHRVACSAENEDFEIAVHRANELLDRLLLETEAKEFRVFLTGKNNFRKQIYPEYKANRSNQPKPVHLEALRHYAIKEWQAEVVETLEADDLMAINQTNDTIIVSLDKDLLAVPGNHYSWEISGMSHGKEWVRPAVKREVKESDGLRHFYEQLLKGDTSDNIKGIEGIGEKKAEKMLAGTQTEEEMFKIVREAYDNDEEMLMNGRVLWIKRTPDDDWKDRFEQLQEQTGNRGLEKTKGGVSVDEV